MSETTPFLRGAAALVARYPLHLSAAFLAAVLCDLLVTMQPLFLRAFIDEASSGLARQKLWLFPSFLLAAAVLAYAFDMIAVSIRFFLREKLTLRLSEAYLDFADRKHEAAVQFSLRSGISSYAELALSVSLDFILALSRIAIILLFMALDQSQLALAAGAAVLVGLAVSATTTGKIGRISLAAERAKGRLAALALKRSPSARDYLTKLYAFGLRLYGLKSLNVLVTLCLFRALPIGALALYLMDKGLSLGALASTFLYFSMLRAPYSELTSLMQESQIAISSSALFLSDLSRGLDLQNILARTPYGLIWDKSAAAGGAPLSGLGEDDSGREYFDDVPAPPAGTPRHAKDKLMSRLAQSSRSFSICLHSDDPAARNFVHFIRHPDGRFTTALVVNPN